MDKVDENLGCILLRLYWASGESDLLLPAKESGLNPVGAIRETVQTGRQNTMTSITDKEDERENNHFRVFEGTGGWETELFYVNRSLWTDWKNLNSMRSKRTERRTPVLAYLATILVLMIEISCTLKCIAATGSEQF